MPHDRHRATQWSGLGEQDWRQEAHVAEIPRGRRVTGPARATLGTELAARYRSGESIRQIAASLGRSYGFVRGVLLDAGVTLRGRGGAVRRTVRTGR
jgi:hypothetical protein